MPLSWNEIKSRALTFSRTWSDAADENAQAKPFWMPVPSSPPAALPTPSPCYLPMGKAKAARPPAHGRSAHCWLSKYQI